MALRDAPASYGWEADHGWADRYLPVVKRILGEHLIGVAPLEEDRLRNTDLIVLRLDAIRVACRIRRHQYLGAYSEEFTLRSGRPHGTETELTKVVRGWGDYLFYGFAAAGGDGLAAWVLGDLDEFRLWFQRQLVLQGGVVPGTCHHNADGSSAFHAFALADLPSAFVVARQEWDGLA